MLDSVNSDPVDVIQVGNLYAATGHVFAKADTLKGNSGTIHSEHEVNITVRNDSPSPLQIQNIEIPNDPGGNIYLNDQLVSTAADIRHINLDKTANVGFALSTTPNAFTPTVNIISRFDPNVAQWNPTVNGHNLDVSAPEITLAAGPSNSYAIDNRGGAVNILNRHGSIHQYGQINASEVSVTAGGALFVNDKTPGIHNIGAHPEANGGFGLTAASRLDNVGFADQDVGGCAGASGNLRLDPNNSESCTEGNLSIQDSLQNGDTGNRIVGGKIFLVANTVNLNGVIQSGIAEKSITIDANEPEFDESSGSHTVNNEDIALRVTRLVATNEAIAREGINGLTASYNADDDVIEVSGLEAKGGQITIAGKLISTGHGQINVLDGYGSYNVTNNSTKDVRLNYTSTGEIEGKLTLIDNAKDNGNGDPLVTQYTRNGNTIRVRSNAGQLGSTPDQNVAGLDGASGRSSHYDPLTGQRYFWIQAEDIGVERNYLAHMSAWETIGINHSFHASYVPPTSSFTNASTLSVADLGMADYAAVDVSTNADYRMRPKFLQESYSLSSSDENYHCAGIPWLVRKCWWDQVSLERETGTMFYFQDVKADKRVNVNFIGSDTGVLNVVSNGGIRINGEIASANSSVTLDARGGNIIMENASATLNAGDLTLAASGSVGTASDPIKVLQGDQHTVDATSASGLFIRSDTGSLRFADLDNSAGDVEIYAGQDIEFETATNAVTGDDITLTALYGSITETGGGAININTGATGDFNAVSRTGDLNFNETAGDLRIGTVDGIGDVTISTAAGSIIDANIVQTDDTATQAELLALWDDLQLRGANATAKRDAQVQTYEAEMTALYQDYWAMRDAQPSGGGYIAQDYDPNFAYTATADERAALNNDPARIASYEASKQARYQQAYEKFGDPAYDPNYSYAYGTLEDDENMIAGYFWADHELEVPLPGTAFKETTDTTAYIENPNIIGRNITLTSNGGNIGVYSTVASFDIQDVIDGNLSAGDKISLSAAESDDVAFDNIDAITAAPELDDDGNPLPQDALTGTVTLTERKDLDIKVRDATSVVNINVPGGYAYIGGENSTHGLNVNTIAAQGEVRLKINGDIVNARSDNNAVLTSQAAVIESGDGAIGSASTPFRTDIADSYNLTARAQTGVWLEEVNGDINVGQIYSPNTVNIVSAGGIFDGGNDLITDIKSDVVQLTAAGAIGEQYLATDSSLVKKQKALDVASMDYGSSQFAVTSGADGAWLYSQLGQSLRITGADLAGELDVAVGANLRAQGSFDTDGNDVNFRSYESLQIDGDGLVNTNGAMLNLESAADIVIASNLQTQGGSITAEAENLTIEEDATIDLGAGSLRVDVDEDATITGITTSNSDSCAAGQTGCAITVLATNIRDGGDVNSDISINGAGGIRFGAHQYTNVNDITQTGSGATNLELGGKVDGARSVAAMLGINSAGGVDVNYLSVNSAAINQSVGTAPFNVTNGNIRDNLYLDIGAADGGLFKARIGRLEDNLLQPDNWLLAGETDSYFANGAVAAQTGREDDYRCTGQPSYIANQNAVLSFNFSFNRPFVDCSGVLNYYSQAYSLLRVTETVNQQVLGETTGLISNLQRSTGIAGNQDIFDTARQSFAISPSVQARSAATADLRGNGALQNPAIGQNQRRSIAEALSVGILDNSAPQIINIENTEEAAIDAGNNLPDDTDLGPQAALDAGVLLQDSSATN